MNDEKPQCHFCKKIFTRLSSLNVHLCESKRRWANRDDKNVRMAFAAWLHWCKKTGMYYNKKTALTYDDFMNSSAYIPFVKFGYFVEEHRISNYLSYIDFMVKNNYKISDWGKDSTYEYFIKMNTRQESVEDAIQKTIKFIDKWSIDNGIDWTDFFIKVSNQQVLDWLRSGRISPWLFFVSEKAQGKIHDMSDEQLILLDKYLDVKWWNQNLRRKPKEKQFVDQIVKEYNI
jgi:hypothetical protein